MEPKEKKAFEPTGLVPRSIVRTFERFRQQLLPGSERAAIREYRISRYQVLVSARCLFVLLTIPIATNWFISSWLLSPIIEHFWNTQQNEIFLNSYQEERAFAELEFFSEKLFFESLLSNDNLNNSSLNVNQVVTYNAQEMVQYVQETKSIDSVLASHFCVCTEGTGTGNREVKQANLLPFLNLETQNFSRRFNNFISTDFFIYNKFGSHQVFSHCLRHKDVEQEPFSSCLPNKNTQAAHTLMVSLPDGIYGSQPMRASQLLQPVQPKFEIVYKHAQVERSLKEVIGMQTNSDFFKIPDSILNFTCNCVDKFDSSDDFVDLLCLPCCAPCPEGAQGHARRGTGDAKPASNTFGESPTNVLGPSKQFIDSWNINTTENSLKIKEKIQEKILELAVYYNQQTILSITNVAGDVISIFTLGCLFIWMKPEISILKSFLIEAIYSLSDTTKSFLLILLTDLLVGFHSPRGWETALEILLKHFGLPENQDFVFLFVATFPVLLDTVFKYWIFRHLNKISPSTVATYHSMIE